MVLNVKSYIRKNKSNFILINIVGSKRHLSSGIEPTLTQETLIMTSV